MGLVTLDRKVDIISIVALLLSLSSAAYQVNEYLRGSDLKMLQPEGITIYKLPIENYGDYVSLIVPVSYVNRGAKDTDTVVVQELATISIGKSAIDLVWHQTIAVKSASDRMDIVQERNVTPFSVAAGTYNANLIWFTPQTVECGAIPANSSQACDQHRNYVKWGDFINIVHSEQLAGTENITISITARKLDEKPQTVKCTINLGPEIFSPLVKHGYYNELCNPTADG